MKSKFKKGVRGWWFTLAIMTIILAGGGYKAHAFNHPCIPTTLQELDTIKASLDRQPWKSSYAGLTNASTSQLSWPPEGPWETVSRTPDVNLTYWKDDMNAVYNLARMWYFTGNEAYAQKAHDIILAWATTQTSFGGHETALSLGDFAVVYAGGADILRGTWPGWTEADTIAVRNYFENVTWPATIAGYNTTGPANKGVLSLAAGIAVAAFCDDTNKFNHCIEIYRTSPASGLFNTLPTGEMGETGRDLGHSYGTLISMAVISEIAWKQGIDLYSELDNRLLACGEYYARNSFALDNPFVPFGTIDFTYYANNSYYFTPDSSAFSIIQNAYKNRMGLPTPWIDRRLESLGGENLMYAKTADFSTATPPPAVVRPPVSLATNGLTLTTLGSQTAGSSVSYANGVWTMTGLGGGVWNGTGGADDCQFAYQAMTGDCAMVVRVTSATASGSNDGKVGLMIRDSLSATVSRRAWGGIVPNASPILMESRQDGWTDNWGGSNWARRSNALPPGWGLPYWLKIERRSDMIATYISQDGTSWAPLVNSYYANLPATVYIGMFICSGTATANTATFDHVAFTGGSGGPVTTPAAPATLLASGSGKAITVRWVPSFGATAYDLLRSTTSGSGYTVIASDLTADKTSYVDTTVSRGTTYYYVARAKNSAGTSTNSPEFDAALLPAPMANLATTGTANDDQNNPANAGNAFDQSAGSLWFHGGGTTGWLQYDFGAGNAQVVKRYTVNSASLLPARDPKDWTFLGSQDGVNWTTLDSEANQSFTYRLQRNTYDLSNTTAYRYYRFNITANNGDLGLLHVGDLGLWNDSGRTIPNGRYVLVSRNSNQVMDGSDITNGTPLLQQTFTGGNSQQWDITWQSNGWYRATAVGSTNVIDNGGTSNPGANLAIQPRSGSTSQLWTFVPDSDGFWHITSANSGLVAAVSGGATTNGANIIQGTYNDSDSQLWMPSIAVAPQPAPPAPTVVTATPASIYQINLSWTASSGAVSYYIKRATVSGGPYTTIAEGVNTTNYVDTGLSAGTMYYYVISGVNGSGEGADSAQAQATTLAGPPAAPTGLSTILGTGRFILSWVATGGATGYTVKRATTSGGPYTTIASGVADPIYTDTNITSGVVYYYVIAATNAYGSSPDSAETVAGPGTLGVYLKFDETGGGIAADSSGYDHDATLVKGPGFGVGILDNALNLTATSSQYATLPDGIASGLTDFTISTWIKVNSFATWQRIFDFGTGTDNYMYLAAQGPAGTGRPRFSIRTSGVEQFIDSSIALTAGVWTHVAVTRSSNTVSLYVNGTLAGSATITLSPADLGFTTQNYLGKSQFNDPYLNCALDDFRIYSQSLSPAEVTALAHPPAGAPRQLVAISGDRQVVLTWDPNATTSYTVKRSTTSGGPHTTIASGITATSYTDTGLINGVTYYYVVSGSNGGSPGPDSVEVSATPSLLLLHLKFDETSGTNAADSTGHGWSGTLVSGPTWVAGYSNNAVNLSGASQYVTLPAGVVSSLTNFTISAWVKQTTISTWSRIFDFGTGQSVYMFLAPKNGANNVVRFAITTGGGKGEQRIDGTAALPTGVWTHVAVTLSGSTGVLYVNGVPVGTNSTMTLTPAALGSTGNNYIGKSQYNDPYLNGQVDEFRIYTTALSASQVSDLKTGNDTSPPAVPTGLVATPGNGTVSLGWAGNAELDFASYTVYRSTTSGSGYLPIASGLTNNAYVDSSVVNGTTCYYVVTATDTSTNESAFSAEAAATPSDLSLHLKFDETGGTNAADSSFRGENATLFNGPIFTTGEISNALTFASSSTQYATLPTGVLDGLTNCTIMGWVKLNTVANWQRIFDFGTGVNNYMFLTTQYGTGGSADKLRFAIRTPAVPENAANQLNSSVTTPIGSWAHFAVVLSGSTGRLYLNGSQVAVSTTMTLNPSSLGVTTQNYLGKSQWPDPYLDGSLDDFRIYNRALSAGEIGMFQTQLSAPTGLAATPGNAQVQLNWNNEVNATSYTLSRSGNSGGPFTAIAQLSSTNFMDTNVVNSGTYYYVVRAANLTGESPDSQPVSAQLVSLVPPNLSFTVSGGQLQFSWPGDHTGWRLQMNTDLSTTNWQAVPGSDAANYILIPPTNGSAYFRLVYP